MVIVLGVSATTANANMLVALSAVLLPHHYFLFLVFKFLSSKDAVSDHASVSESTEDDEDENWELEYSSQYSPGDNVRREHDARLKMKLLASSFKTRAYFPMS